VYYVTHVGKKPLNCHNFDQILIFWGATVLLLGCTENSGGNPPSLKPLEQII